ncbi:hypothetical protein Nepgr_014103 [Nepenthes gracilis]|uniref:Protein-S-isoprenylcysteine O-methyltransferase n=1 Tax=Nepenthes gracilis TaxID=150966 RepID=A0AAD3SJF9_NEPGR|nr:hypothetical protein Nepgr_014103 [Nepenthes gracilis]
MAVPSDHLCRNGHRRGSILAGSNRVSLRHLDKHLEVKLHPNTSLPNNTSPLSIRSLDTPSFSSLASSSPNFRRTRLLQPIKCSYSDNTTLNSQNPILKTLGSFPFESVKTTLSQLTPIDICKWSGVIAIAIAAAKWTVNLLFNPFFWMYLSWTWLFWPWFVALALAVYGIYCFSKHLRGEANVIEQLAVVTSAFTWLTLVPPAHFNGFLEGWPYVFFFVYHYFFFFNVSVRKRLYGDYYPRPHDPKWDFSVPKWYRILFCAGVMLGHWLAAFEGPELHRIPGGWSNLGIWALIMITLFMQYKATFYLAKYSEKVVVPTAVVQYGPYRWVRHPVYASTMLLFFTYSVALRAPISSLFMVLVCVIYYHQKTNLEEALMLDTFGERYMEYMSKVRFKFIPFVY